MSTKNFLNPLRYLVLAVILVGPLALLVPMSMVKAAVVTFPDANLKAAVWDALGKPHPVGDIVDTDLVGLTTLSAVNENITDLTGLEHCTALTTLYLDGNGTDNLTSNHISDLTPLSGLTNLTYLSMDFNQISDILPVDNLTNLTYLSFNNNLVSDISPLDGLTNLETLWFEWNQTDNLTPLSGLVSLMYLGVNYNQISDISPVDKATGQSLTPTLQSSGFSDPDAGDTHRASRWQITSVSGDYTSPVWDSLTDNVNLVSRLVPSGRLSLSTTYYWHVKHQDNHGDWSDWSAETSFTTLSLAPSVTTEDAGSIGTNSACINGNLASLGMASTVTVSFEYGTTKGGPYTLVAVGVKSGAEAFSANLNGLTPGTKYYFRAKAVGQGDPVYGEEKTFTTAPDVTAPTTPQVTGDYTATTGEIHASWSSSDAESGVVEYAYAIGTSPGGNDVVDWTSAGTAVEVGVTGLSLKSGDTYYVSVKARNGQGLWSEVSSSDGITVSASGKEGGVPFWVWILVAAAVLALGAVGIVFWRKRSAKPA